MTPSDLPRPDAMRVPPEAARTRPEPTPAVPPPPRHGANIRLIQSRLADQERTRARRWWRFLK